MIYTFYSFKGGVGRSMAMAHVGYELASRGLRVLAIDFDLEAPGLERYFGVPEDTVRSTRGVIDLIDSYKRSLSGDASMGADADFRQLQHQFICPVAAFGGSGRLDLMPAGLRRSDDDWRAYALAVRTFDWQDFYFNWEGEAFFEWLRRTLSVGGGDSGEPPLYDVVLADSRTGVTEMGGVCACQLADVVVMLSAANDQNIRGTQGLAADLRSPAVAKLRRNRELQIVVVPSRVEQREPGLLPAFVERFDRTFGDGRPPAFVDAGVSFHDLTLPYEPEYAFAEHVTERGGAPSPLMAAYATLCDALLLLTPAGAAFDAVRAQALASLAPGRATPREAAPARAFDATHRYAGFDAYLSCAHDDRSVVRALAEALAGPAFRLRTQLSDAAEYGGDRDLPAATAELLNHVQVLVLCAGAAGVMPWQRAELKLARSLPAAPRVVQLLLPGAADDAFEIAFGAALRDALTIDLRGWPADTGAVAVLAQGLRQSSAAPSASPDAPAAAMAPPFPGAAAYDETAQSHFFGRDAAIDALAALVAQQRRVLLRGPSGAGKTSLLLAGLLPRLRRDDAGVQVSVVDLRSQPQAAVGSAMSTLPAQALLVVDHAGEGDAAALQALAGLWRRSDGPRMLLCGRDAALAGSSAAIAQRWHMQGRVAAQHRTHRLHHEATLGVGAERLRAALADAPALDLAALDPPGLRSAVDAALAASGRRAETGLLERLFTDAGAAPSMAAVQRVLKMLWDAQHRGWFTNEAYDAAGGIDGPFVAALRAWQQSRADLPDGSVDALWLRLLQPGGDDAQFLQRRSFSWARECTDPAFQDRAADVACGAAAAGLVTLQRSGSDVVLALAHLPRAAAWPQLQALRAAAAWATAAAVVADAYARWAAGNEIDASALPSAAELPALTPHLSLGEQAMAAREVATRRRRRTLRIAGAVTLLLVVAGAGIWNTMLRRDQRSLQQQVALDAARAQVTELVQSNALTQPGAAPAMGRLRVFVHRSGGDSVDLESAETLARALPSDAYAVEAPIERVATQVCGDVRYSRPQDRDAAVRAQELLNGLLANNGDPRRLQLNDRSDGSSGTAAQGLLEIWLPPLSEGAWSAHDAYGDWRLVASGCAVIGSDAKGRETLRKALDASGSDIERDELPLGRVWLPAYYISRTEVTMAQFAAYQQACETARGSACPPWRPRYVDARTDPQRPAVYVGWQQAADYCAAAGGRLPGDVEWEKAARGPDGRFWPWGDKPDDAKFQGKSQSPRQPVNVGSFPSGNGPYGTADMAGNVWEYTRDLWRPGSGPPAHTIRGGSYLNALMEARASVRWASGSETVGTEHLGFRCVRDVKPRAAAPG